jgi:regulator of replication initiation timing
VGDIEQRTPWAFSAIYGVGYRKPGLLDSMERRILERDDGIQRMGEEGLATVELSLKPWMDAEKVETVIGGLVADKYDLQAENESLRQQLAAWEKIEALAERGHWPWWRIVKAVNAGEDLETLPQRAFGGME